MKTKDRPAWGEKETQAFETLKKALCTAPILIRPNWSKPFILLTDASRSGLGAVLSQLDDENRERVILYASRGLKPNEKNYGISKLECLAVVWAVELLRPYLLSKEFTIYTDHSALKGLLQNPNPSSILARWIVKLTDYSYTIKYRPGKALKNVDFLSCLGY